MKISDELKRLIASLHSAAGDPEVYHIQYDFIIKERLRLVDPEFMDYLDAETSDKPEFWYA